MSKRRRTTEGLAGRWEWIFGSTAAGFGVCGRCDMADGTNEISEMRIPEQGRMQGCFWLCMPLRAVATILFHISAHRCLETRKSDSLAQFMMLICRSVGERRTARARGHQGKVGSQRLSKSAYKVRRLRLWPPAPFYYGLMSCVSWTERQLQPDLQAARQDMPTPAARRAYNTSTLFTDNNPTNKETFKPDEDNKGHTSPRARTLPRT